MDNIALSQPLALCSCCEEEGMPLLSFSLTLPQLEGNGPAAIRINRYYARLFRKQVCYYQTTLARREQARYLAAQAQALPYSPRQELLTSQLDCPDNTILIVRLTCTSIVENQCVSRQIEQRWSLPLGFPLE